MPGNNPSRRTSIISDGIEILRFESLSYLNNSARHTSISEQTWTTSGRSGRANHLRGGTTEAGQYAFVEYISFGYFQAVKAAYKIL